MRKLTYIGRGLAALLALTPQSNSTQAPLSEAKRFYQDFPTQIPGAARIEKVIDARRADHCIVHVRQKHEVTGILPSLTDVEANLNASAKAARSYPDYDAFKDAIEENLSKKEKYLKETREKYLSVIREVRDVQRNMYEVYTYLHQNLGISTIRSEGISGILSPSDCLAEMAQVSETLSRKGYVSKKEAISLDGYLFYGGADRILGAQEAITLRGLEHPELNREGVELGESLIAGRISREEYKIRFKANSEKRENYVLDLLEREGECVSFVSFGADHSFKDNIERWNREHPFDTYSLIVITPEKLIENAP